jgi:hypothetical protein
MVIIVIDLDGARRMSLYPQECGAIHAGICSAQCTESGFYCSHRVREFPEVSHPSGIGIRIGHKRIWHQSLVFVFAFRIRIRIRFRMVPEDGGFTSPRQRKPSPRVSSTAGYLGTEMKDPEKKREREKKREKKVMHRNRMT